MVKWCANYDKEYGCLPLEMMGEEQMSRYSLYMSTLGNRPDLFPESALSLIHIFQSSIIGVTMWALGIVIFVLVYGRMLEIYLLTSLAPIPMATI